jgi:hypothetical protein
VTSAKYLLVSAAQRVWLDLYLNKKSQLEECLKVSLDSIGRNPTLDELRPVLTEPAAKCWSQFVESGHGANRQPMADKIQSQLQARLTRVVTGGISTVAGGFNRVVSMKKPKKEVARLGWRELAETTAAWTANASAVREYAEAEARRFFRHAEQRHAYAYEEWTRGVERDVLLRERALWGDGAASALAKFRLDFTEGPCRQRKRLLDNTDEFYRLYPYRPELEAVRPSKKYKTPSSLDSRQFYKEFRVRGLLAFGEQVQQFVIEQARYAVLEQQYAALGNQMMSSEQATSEVDQQLAILYQQQQLLQQQQQSDDAGEPGNEIVPPSLLGTATKSKKHNNATFLINLRFFKLKGRGGVYIIDGMKIGNLGTEFFLFYFFLNRFRNF